MKKILFLSFAYPYGHFNPSDLCSTRIMKALVETGKYEVHCISCKSGNNNQCTYPHINGVITHYLPFSEGRLFYSRWLTHIQIVLLLPFYPFKHLWSNWKYYHACKKIILDEKYDLVIAQCNPEYSVIAGSLFKKNRYIDKLLVIFWDNFYGKLPRRFVPESYAIKRQRKVESWIARYADSLVSLYPLKAFHEKYGDVAEANGKRHYLGIPSIIQPLVNCKSSYKNIIKDDMINILYSGTVFRAEYVEFLVHIMNETKYANRINLIFFSRGVSENVFSELRATFKGTLQNSDWIPHKELLGLYNHVDFFVSFPGLPTAIRSKVFEYMSYGKPLILLYDDETDVNVTTFSRYPACLSVDERTCTKDKVKAMESYLDEYKEKKIPFEQVLRLFPLDSAMAYVDIIDSLLNT